MTICVKCGSERDGIGEACPACHFQPATNRDLAIAALLTTEFEAGSTTWGTPQPVLESMAGVIRGGSAPSLDEAAIRRHERAVKSFLAVSPAHIASGLGRLFLPAVGFILGLLTVLVLWRLMR